MTKLVAFLGRKPVSAAGKPAPAPQPVDVVPDKPDKIDIELDQDLFLPAASQLGLENETVRTLLIDAEHKIGELERIKSSIGQLLDPVSKMLRDYEQTKSEKLSLQNVLHSTRIAHNKLRDDLGATEKKARTLEAECARLHEVLTMAQESIAAHEKTKAEHLAELATHRSHVAELQRHVQEQSADLQQTREENRRNVERVTAAGRRAVQLEGEARAAQQKAMQSAQEGVAVQAALDKAHADLAQTARRLTESDKTLNATQARFEIMEAGLTEAEAEQTRLSAALDEANHKYIDAVNTQNSRFESLQARSNLTESLLEEARQTLMARADEIRSFERHLIASATARHNANEKLADMTAALAERETQLRELEQAYAAVHEHNQMLSDAAAAHDSSYGNAEQKIKKQAELIQLLEQQIHGVRSANEMQLQQLEAQLQREQLERSVAEGALESGRRDIARLLHEIGSMHHRPNLAVGTEPPTAAQAA